MATLILVAAVAFVSTNLDDIFVLLSLFADPSLRPAEVVAGQCLGMGIITGLALLGSLVALALPMAWVGLLGLLPLAIGLRRLGTGENDGDGADRPDAMTSFGNIIATATMTAANGGDNVAVYVPLLAGRSWTEVTAVVVVFGIMTAAWCALALIATNHPRTGPPLQRFGRLFLPWIYMGLGAYILVANRAYTVIGAGW